MDHPFPDDAYELRALLLSGMDGLMPPAEWHDACLTSGRLSSWTFANSILVSMQHRLETALHPGMPERPTLIASGAAWARAGRYAKPGARGYRILKADETGGLTSGLVYDISQTDGTPYLNLAPAEPSLPSITTSMESMFGEFESDGKPLRVERGEASGRDCSTDGNVVLLDSTLDDAAAIRVMARELALIILADHEGTPDQSDFIARSASLMVCAAFGCATGGDSPDPARSSGPSDLLPAGGAARSAARRIIAFCGRATGFRDGSLLAPGPVSAGGGPAMEDEPGEGMEPDQSPSIIMDNPVPAIDTTSFDIGGDIL